ncbi:S1C family serine protease [Paracoccus fontiphilus]|uniref:S1C family serine protease n=1 Tax=Paracoccus fontiphilus TaxID=1815556 RepID=A0ABV7I834_9RHOB
MIAIYSPSGSTPGIGFAVPVETTNHVVLYLIATGRHAVPVPGLTHDPRGAALLARAGLAGVMVIGGEPGSPAAGAGPTPASYANCRLHRGALIVSLNGAVLETSEDLHAALDMRQEGAVVEISVLRNGRETTIAVTLAPRR